MSAMMLSGKVQGGSLRAKASASSTKVAMPAFVSRPAQSGRCSCGRARCPGHHLVAAAVAAPVAEAAAAAAPVARDPTNLGQRHEEVMKSFPKSLSADDYISRVEIALAGYGFTGDNTIAMSNLCRDESCMVLEDKIESVFGSCFSTHGLGGVLTCGVIGIKAGLSHSPVQGGKERYVFFSFPHIAIDSDGNVGGISRPNRPGASSACGALIAVTGMLKNEGIEVNCKQPGVHDPLEPEYSILKQRLARRLAFEKADASKLDLVSVTQAAERTITSDLEYLIEKAVDTKKADYAVFTGVQIHNWASNLDDPSIPSLEFVSVGKSYVVVDGEKHYLDLHKVPALSPRQLKVLAALSASGSADASDASATHASGAGMIQEIPRDYLLQRLGGAAGNTTVSTKSPSWSNYVRQTGTTTTPEQAFESSVPQDGKFFSSFQYGEQQM